MRVRFRYLSAPQISAIVPSSVPFGSEGQVTITGTGFYSGSIVTFGGVPAVQTTFNPDESITVTTPTNVTGPVDVTASSPSAGGLLSSTLPQGAKSDKVGYVA